MTKSDILNHRLLNQNISYSGFTRPADLVQWLGGIQGQDYPNAKWAIGARIPSITDEIIEKDIEKRSIIRTWMFRGTLHIVSGKDIHWLLKLLSGRIITSGAARKRQLGLDDRILQKCLKLLYLLLKDNNTLTREEITNGFKHNGIKAEGILLSHILQYSALNGQICFGPKRGSEFTFVLLDEVSDPGLSMSREEALCELAWRYFTSHGPATIMDFIWWSGVTGKDARTALEMVRNNLLSEKFEENEYLMPADSKKPANKKMIYLLPAFDSYLIAYRDRSIFINDLNFSRVVSTNGIFRPIIVKDGKIEGIWKRSFKKDKLIVEANFFKAPKESVREEVFKWANQFTKYLNKDLSQMSINDKVVYQDKNV